MPNVRVLKQIKLCSYVHAPVVLFCIVFRFTKNANVAETQSKVDRVQKI